MEKFFQEPMKVGRFPEKTCQEVFSHHRQYFDQVLYKNFLLHHKYAVAYEEWKTSLENKGYSLRDIAIERIELGIKLTGEEEIKKIFKDVIKAVNAKYPYKKNLPEDTPYRETLPGGKIALDPEWQDHMICIKKMWLRISLPVIREE